MASAGIARVIEAGPRKASAMIEIDLGGERPPSIDDSAKVAG
jgi:hypothetical protein